MKISNKTDWEKLKNLSENEIDYSDIPETQYSFWEDAELILPKQKVEVKLQIDEDIAFWLNQINDKSNIALNNLLRSYYLGLKQFQITK